MTYPPQLTSEEKALKKRYARLQEKRKQLRRMQEKPSPSASSASKQLQKDALNPKDAKEAAKKLLEAGKLMIKSRATTKRTGFKRVGELPGQTPPPKKANTTAAPDQPRAPPKPKIKASDVKAVYNRIGFVKSSTADDMERIPKKAEAPETSQPSQDTQDFSTQKCTVFVCCSNVNEDALRFAFSRFGEIQQLQPDVSKSSAFLTFKTPSIATTAKKEMNNGMIRGSDVRVEFASEENGYIELPPDAASNPWAILAAGRTLKGSQPEGQKQRQRHKEIKSYERDF